MAGFVDFLRNGAWLNEERVVFYARAALCAYVIFAATTIVASPEVLSGKIYARDFSSTWAAGSLALEGHAPAAYDWSALDAREKVAIFHDVPAGHYAWFYPPVFLLCAALLALLPYAWSQLLWLAGTALAYLACMRRLWSHPHARLVAFAWPGVAFNLVYGQNGFLSAALIGGGLLLLESRPVLSGICFGALCYKPQLALLVPVALIAGGHWRALASMAACVLMLCGASLAAFGADTWRAFLEASAATREALEYGTPGFFHFVTPFAAMRLAGASIALAWGVQVITSVLMVAAVAWAWRSRASGLLKGAVLAAAMPLATPFALAYDLMVEAIAVAGLAREGTRTGFRSWERTLIAATAVLPLASPLLARATDVTVAPVVEFALLGVLLRRLAGSTRTRPELQVGNP